MKKYWSLYLVLAVLLGGFYSLPPYAPQATFYYFTHLDELNSMDSAFTKSDDETWKSKNSNLGPILKTKNGSRLYFMGSLRRFNTQYDIAFIRGGRKVNICTPYLIYTSQRINCNIPLGDGWVINYQSAG